MKRIFLCILLFPVITAFSNPVKGRVFGIEDQKQIVLPGAGVVWAGTTIGTMTDENGAFNISARASGSLLVVSFVGYQSDTIVWTGQESVDVVLLKNGAIDEITIAEKNKGNYYSKLQSINIQHINGAELHKAACCNLSESFVTNPSVDVTYNDAMTGTKQIRLLGLDGIYSQLQTENFPNLRGLATNYGLTYIPGPWLESIQVSKGTASVVNGYESISGQINANFKKPDAIEAFHFNVFASAEGKSELNANVSHQLSGKLSTALFVHGENFSNRLDHNMDGFMDEPLIRQIHLFNQWKYNSQKGFMIHSGIHYLDENRLGGQIDFREDMERTNQNPYGVNVKNERFEAYLKAGYDFKGLRHSLAFITNFTTHRMSSYYGLNNYSGDETTFYGNLVHSCSIDEAGIHNLNSGVSLMVDQAEELLNRADYHTDQAIPGVFSEYTFKPGPKLTAMIGLRADFSKTFSSFLTPRFHLRYSPFEDLILRISAGKGYRTPLVVAENSYLLANSRPLLLSDNNILEKAWNYGISAHYEIHLAERPVTVIAEYFRTDFQSQLLVDRESSADYILLNQSNETSFANSYQFEIRYELLPRLDLAAAFRVNDTRQTYDNQLLRKPLAGKYKGLFTLNYSDKLKKWMFDYNLQFNGGGRLPVVAGSPADTPAGFPSFTLMNAQVTKYFRYWNIYTGVENIMDFTQEESVLGADQPFGPGFDATQIWGPLMGRKFYAGIRITINHKNYY